MRISKEGMMAIVPRSCELDGFIEADRGLKGITLRRIKAGSVIKVRTHNSDYEISLLDPELGRASVQGGHFFPQPTEAVIHGSTFGGCMIKMGWLGVGLRIEISACGQSIITSPVQALTVVPAMDACGLAMPTDRERHLRLEPISAVNHGHGG
jgi:hypothetical protein